MSYFLNRLSRRANVSIGVYLTEKTIQILQLELVDNRYYIRNFQRFFISKNKKYINLIRKKIKQDNLKNSKVALVISDSVALRKYIKVSKKLNIQDLDELARIETQKYLSNNEENVCFDYVITNDKQSAYNRMLIIAVHSRLISSKIQFLSTLGLEVNLVDLESNCILRVVNILLLEANLIATVAWFEIGDNTIKTFVIKDREIVLINEDDYVDSNTSEKSNFIDIYTKIERTVLSYNANNTLSPLEILYLSGSYSKLESLRCALAEGNIIPVIIPDIFKLIKTSSTKKIKLAAHKLPITLGMALVK